MLGASLLVIPHSPHFDMFRHASRSFHSTVWICFREKPGPVSFAYTFGATDLKTKIDALIAPRQEQPVARESVLDALAACKKELGKIQSYDKFGRDPARDTTQKGIEALLASERVQFDESLLKSIFLMKFPSKTVISIIHSYYQRNPKATIDLSLALIPLRESLFNAELKEALEITDITTGHANYVEKKNTLMRQGFYRLGATALGVAAFTKFGSQFAVEAGLLLDTWVQLAGLNAVILTYIFNSSFLVALVKLTRQLSTAGGDFLVWQKGTFYTNWYRYSDLMSMCAKIVEADIKLNGGVDSSAWLMEELTRSEPVMGNGFTLSPGTNKEGKKVRLLEARENLEDLKMQAYWITGGDGFEWVEPDQDPAELIWRNQLQCLHNPAVALLDAKSLKWTENLIEEKKDYGA